MTTTVPSWGEAIEQGRRLSARTAVDQVVQAAQAAAQQVVLRRVYRFEDIGQHRSSEPFPEICKILEPEIRQTFALAMSDHLAGMLIVQELPRLAAGYRLSGNAALLQRVLDQLAEMATWSPLQRPGWTLLSPGSRLPPDGKDGNWLATGTCVRTIANVLEIMPAGSVPTDLIARLHALLEKEIADIVDDWRTQRSWFIKQDNPVTNQWVLPTEGLVRACLVTGVERHRDAYELGVANLLRSFAAHGTAGEFEEGIHYAEFTLTSMLHAARAMAAAGDRRALDHPYLARFPTWAAHHFQPGRYLINCFDSYGSRVPRGQIEGSSHTNFARLWALILACTQSPVARWVLREQFDGPPQDDVGLACRAWLDDGPGGAPAAPPLFAAYERAARVNWRDGWGDDATGVWVRGGHPSDQHDHADRGHVNLIRRGRPILIEAGTAYYDHPRFAQIFASACGHNVIQLGTVSPDDANSAHEPGWQKPQAVAPITVHRLDSTGGHVTVDGSRCHDALESWRREVEWTSSRLRVLDRVALPRNRPDVVLLRWHLGTDQDPAVEAQDTQATVHWPDATIHLQAPAPIVIEVVMYPDFTLTDRLWADRSPDALHACLVVRTRDKVNAVEFETLVT